jgi:hypothetical protein
MRMYSKKRVHRNINNGLSLSDISVEEKSNFGDDVSGKHFIPLS